jgi:hypothetical protein
VPDSAVEKMDRVIDIDSRAIAEDGPPESG